MVLDDGTPGVVVAEVGVVQRAAAVEGETLGEAVPVDEILLVHTDWVVLH